MKKALSILLLATAPILAFASGDHERDHGAHHDQGEHHHAGGHEHGQHAHESAIGRPGKAADARRVVRVVMQDSMRFEPADLTFKAGETVRFKVENHGESRHEMVLGDMRELKKHMRMMQKNPNMQHADPNMISLAPGESGELVWQFTSPGSYDFACLVPGHMEAGMVGKITVK